MLISGEQHAVPSNQYLSRYCLLLSAVFCPREPAGAKRLPGAARPGGAPQSIERLQAPPPSWAQQAPVSRRARIPPGSLGPGRALLRLMSTPSPRPLPHRADWLLSFVYVLRAAPRVAAVCCKTGGWRKRGPVLRGEHPCPGAPTLRGWGRRTSSPAQQPRPRTQAPSRSTPDKG